jgi:hypothetical protein
MTSLCKICVLCFVWLALANSSSMAQTLPADFQGKWMFLSDAQEGGTKLDRDLKSLTCEGAGEWDENSFTISARSLNERFCKCQVHQPRSAGSVDTISVRLACTCASHEGFPPRATLFESWHRFSAGGSKFLVRANSKDGRILVAVQCR